ncbi:LysR substrate-binding domain-containing protein [Nitrospirillum iridis]|uniref:DNA-binding transcriptional LysR family regulator n=1 Tax=Nitrospirillum iridis TaxID=765888 RepID=A0A7X0EDK4_9PROT|nr:LysR substrate-binding domain-containing protein [Nitrospirillum iridis]MBB6252882.1 DNA-binding transcriptional LysR family regulator [Nitrospirillum iridis]
MRDLNDLYYFAQVVEHGGFAAAERALGVPKSTLSRRVSLLEEQLGVRLLQRSTRRFAVTDVGRTYHAHCLAMIAEAAAAQEVVDRTRSEPQGTVRVSCPTALVLTRVGPVVTRYMAQYPRVNIRLEASNRRVDVIEEGYDLAIRVRMPPLDDSDLIVRVLESHGSALVASPEFLDRHGRPTTPGDLAALPSADMPRTGGEYVWRLYGPDGILRTVAHQPRLITEDMGLLRDAALTGVAMTQLPHFVIDNYLAQGALETLLPGWTLPTGVVHVVFPSRRGLVPAVRGFIDALAAEFADRPTTPCPANPAFIGRGPALSL